MKKILIIVVSLMMFGCVHEVRMKAKVLDHVVTADKGGYRTYSTIVKTTDGEVRELTGLKNYVVPIGSEIYVTVYKQNK
jgi:hypothetical protein